MTSVGAVRSAARRGDVWGVAEGQWAEALSAAIRATWLSAAEPVQTKDYYFSLLNETFILDSLI